MAIDGQRFPRICRIIEELENMIVHIKQDMNATLSVRDEVIENIYIKSMLLEIIHNLFPVDDRGNRL